MRPLHVSERICIEAIFCISVVIFIERESWGLPWVRDKEKKGRTNRSIYTVYEDCGSELLFVQKHQLVCMIGSVKE